ncbi:hypothetical protein [Bacillus solitudinis]|uniref:hypothetical protein n=1 Tax=Bacillus solitudinis TaxID=2014074 RepID=UPI000C23FF8C|nr:hypothetical protein [Bacillus solitudinis]
MTHAGTGRSGEEKDTPLSQLIDALNDRFNTDFTKEDQLFFEQLEEAMVNDVDLAEQAKNNSIENFQYVFDEKFINTLIDRRELNQGIFAKVMDDEKFQSTVKSHLIKSVYDRLHEASSF